MCSKPKRRRFQTKPLSKPKSKQTKLTDNLSRILLQYVQGKRYAPSTFQELTEKLALPEVHHPLLKDILKEFVTSGKLLQEKQRYRLPPKASLTQGTISVHPKGFGFVKFAEGPDVFIPKHAIGEAVDGDQVEIDVNPIVSAKGPEGQVVSVTKRSRTHLAGTIISKTARHYTAYAPLLGPDKPLLVKSKGTALKEGDRVICQITEWSNANELPEGVLSQLIGHISDASIDIQAAIEEFELPSAFSQEAIEEAKQYGSKVKASDCKHRKDLSDWECVTIDPDTARDYDDAISITKDERGHFFLGVHIADVAHYVKSGSCLDREALERCNSTYFPGKCVPMLPEQLSNELCSLKPKVKRLTQSVLAEFSSEGDLIHSEIVRSCIKSQKRFTYKEALQVLEKKKKSPHLPLLERMVQLCHLFKKKRMERGSIDFAMPDDVILVDEKGEPLRIERVEYDITHQMIEEFMLKANELVATHLGNQGKTLIYRVHEEPSEESFQDFYTFARSLGFFLPAKPKHKDIQKLFQDAKDSPLLPQLSVSFIRSMKLACYSPDNIGHYGLALDHYCHFTSPIRRYTDLIIQRLLFDELPESTPVEEIALACSEKERISFRAESSVVILKKLRLANRYFQEDPTRLYSAIITRAKPFALFFEVPLFDLEGSFHISKIGQDFYEYNPKSMTFRGSRTGKTYCAGQEITVRLDKIDYILQHAEWSMIHPQEEAATSSFKKNKRKGKNSLPETPS